MGPRLATHYPLPLPFCVDALTLWRFCDGADAEASLDESFSKKCRRRSAREAVEPLPHRSRRPRRGWERRAVGLAALAGNPSGSGTASPSAIGRLAFEALSQGQGSQCRLCPPLPWSWS